MNQCGAGAQVGNRSAKTENYGEQCYNPEICRQQRACKNQYFKKLCTGYNEVGRGDVCRIGNDAAFHGHVPTSILAMG